MKALFVDRRTNESLEPAGCARRYLSILGVGGAGMRAPVSSAEWRGACLVFLCALVLALTSCATQPTPSTYDPPGFWFGLLHGFLIVFSLIGSLFGDVRVYAFPNSGLGYDFGYVIGAAMFLGGGGAGARTRDEQDA